MLTTKPSKIKYTLDQVQGIKEVEVDVEIGTNEALDDVPCRVDEVAAVIDGLVLHDAKFAALDIYQQAAYLEHSFIFGPAGHSVHFARQCYLDLLLAKRDGKVKDLKDAAVAKQAEKPRASLSMASPAKTSPFNDSDSLVT